MQTDDNPRVREPLRRGDFVQLTIGDWSVPAMVGIASSNGKSIMVLFDGAAPVGDGFLLGLMPLSQRDDGSWYEIVRQTTVTVERRHR